MALNVDCLISVVIEGSKQPCGRARAKVADLCCPEHWKLVPKPMKQRLIDADRIRSERKRERASIDAAGAVLHYLEHLKVQLPPVQKVQPSGGIERPGQLVSASGELVSRDSKLIIPGR